MIHTILFPLVSFLVLPLFADVRLETIKSHRAEHTRGDDLELISDRDLELVSFKVVSEGNFSICDEEAGLSEKLGGLTLMLDQNDYLRLNSDQTGACESIHFNDIRYHHKLSDLRLGQL